MNENFQFRENFRSPDCSLEGHRIRLQTQIVRNREQYHEYEYGGYIERNMPEPDYDGYFSVDIENREYRGARFSINPYIRQNETEEPKSMAIGYMERGYPPESFYGPPAPEAIVIDRRTEVSNVDVQFQQTGTTWNTQSPFTVQNYPQIQLPTTEKEEIKPRKIWWYTTSRVFSALLIICNLVSDWLQVEGFDDPVSDAQDTIKDQLSGGNCTETTGEKKQNAANLF